MFRYAERKREGILREAFYNIAMIPNRDIKIDLFSDSLMHFVLPNKKRATISRIESSHKKLQDTFKRNLGYKFVLPVAQGRTAEIILARIMVNNAMVVPGNMLFVTTRINQELNGASVLEIPVQEAYDLNSDFPFKGNMDIARLEQAIVEHGNDWVPYIYVETCVNASGGHPVSMKNIKEVNFLSRRFNIPVILDACRILENAWLIREREAGYGHKSLSEIVREFCSYADGCTMSATKDFFVDSGGFIATNSEEIYYQLQDAVSVFGDGLSLMAKARLNDALERVFNSEKTVILRAEKVNNLWKKLKDSDVPVVNPHGGHGVFIDAKQLYDVLSPDLYPEKAFLGFLYQSSGIRAGENILTPHQEERGIKMLRLALPVAMYSFSQIDYIARHFSASWKNKRSISGLTKVYQPPSLTGSFYARYGLKRKDR